MSKNENYIITPLYNGIGNVLCEIINGLLFKKVLSKKYTNEFSLFCLNTSELFGNHQLLFNKEHQESEIPNPRDLDQIFPNLKFINEVIPTNYFLDLTSKIDIQSINETKIFLKTNSIENLLEEISSNLDILKCLSPSDSIKNYIFKNYNPDINSLGIHIRLHQQGDYMKTKYPTQEWYKKAIQEMKKKKTDINKIFVVSGISGSLSTSMENFNQIMKTIQDEFQDKQIIIIKDEPYYIDLFLLSFCHNLIISNSSFSLMSGILSLKEPEVQNQRFLKVLKNEEHTIFYPDLMLELNRQNPIYIKDFNMISSDNFVQY